MSDTTMRIQLAFHDLEARTQRAGAPWNAATEIGVFVEDLHRTLCSMAKKKEDFPIQEWHTLLTELSGQEVKQQLVLPMTFAYSWRNLGTHSNEQRYDITWADVSARLSDLIRGVEHLMQWLDPEEFAAQFFRSQRGARQLRRAANVFFLLEPIADDHLWSLIEPTITVSIAKPRLGFMKAPTKRRIARAIEELAGISTPQDDKLGSLIDRITHNLANDGRDALENWRKADRLRQATFALGHAIPVIRLTIQGGDEPATFRLDRIEVEGRAVPQWRERIAAAVQPHLPLNACNFGTTVTRIQSVLTTACLTENMPQPRWREWVLRIQLPDALARLEFEHMQFRGSSILTSFRCVTICPSDEVSLRGYRDAITHPSVGTTAVAEWGTSDVSKLRFMARDRECLFTGPNGWAGNTEPPVLLAYADMTCAIMVQEPDQDTAISGLFRTDEQLSLECLFDRVTELRMSNHNVKVIWDDPSYRNSAAVAV